MMRKTISTLLLSVTSFSITTGCGTPHFFYTEPPLGSISDDVWRKQEHNAEASDFVLYQHEFKLNEVRLNTGGEDHIKQIADRIANGEIFPVVIERSNSTARPGTDYKFPIHPNPELDMQRRKLVVMALERLGVSGADERVVVAPAFAEGYQSQEALNAYRRGFSTRGGGGGGFGGGGGGGFGGGGFF